MTDITDADWLHTPGRGGSIAQRYLRKVSVQGDDECWPWMGSHDPRTKRGKVWLSHNQRMGAPRMALLVAGSHPADDDAEWQACHTCDNPNCVNPAHLYWGTRKDNARDTVERGQHPHARKTHCKNGHALAGDNLRFRRDDGSRQCHACNLASKRRRYAEGFRRA